MRYISLSEITTYLRCREEHRFAYADGIRAKKSAMTLDFGTVLHAARAEFWRSGEARRIGKALDDAADSVGVDRFERVRAEVMISGYTARWWREQKEILTLGVEEPFFLQRHPENADPYTLIGAVDSYGRKDGRDFVSEFKTTSSDIEPGSDYWARLSIDWQVSLYALAMRQRGVAGICLYDVARKPERMPLKATPVEKRRWTSKGELYAKQRDKDESEDEFRTRLVEEISAAPESYYGRTMVVRLEDELDRVARDVDTIAADIFRSEPGVSQPQTSESCRRYGSLCGYFPVCSKQTDLDDPRYEKKVSPLRTVLG